MFHLGNPGFGNSSITLGPKRGSSALIVFYQEPHASGQAVDIRQAADWANLASHESTTHGKARPILMNRFDVVIGTLKKLQAAASTRKLQGAKHSRTKGAR